MGESEKAGFTLTRAFSVLFSGMTTLKRTAYLTFKTSLTSTELEALYTPSAAEIAFAQAEARTRSGQLSVLVLLKAFQRLVISL